MIGLWFLQKAIIIVIIIIIVKDTFKVA